MDKSVFCQEPSGYSEENYQYIRTSSKKGHNKKTKYNKYYKELASIFEKAFKPITASKRDIPFMNDVFCYPSEACDVAQSTIEEIVKSLRREGVDPKDKFKELREGYIKDQFLEDMLKSAKQTLPTSSQAGQKPVRIWCGEKGCGKTTLINHIFLKYYSYFDDEQIIWIRTSVFFKTFPDDINGIKLKFYKQCVKIILKHYADKLNLDDHEVKCKIWEGEFDDQLPPKMVKEKIKNLALHNEEEHAKRLIRYCYNNGWAFIFIIDNIDHYQRGNDIVKDIINFSFHLGSYPVRSLVVIVSRWETIIDHHNFLHNVYNNFKYIEHLPMPNFSDVFHKRLAYVKNRISDGKSCIHIKYGDKTVGIKKSVLIDHFVQYFLSNSPVDDGNGYIISDLANNNIRKMFSMMETILKSHIEDVASIPLHYLVEIKGIDNKRAPVFDETMRQHMTIWALALKDGYLHYKDDINRSWIQNIYFTSKPNQSIFLKRLILDFVIFCETVRELNSVDYTILENVFVKEMGFEYEEFGNCLKWLTNREGRSPFLVYYITSEKNSNEDDSFKISRKGMIYAKYLSELFTYIELIIEDMILPYSSEQHEYSIDLKLIPYDPLLIEGKAKRRIYRMKYFFDKKKQVESFMFYLKCKYEHERRKYNNFSSRKMGFYVEYFPKMEQNLKHQMIKVESSFKRA
ncbi:MAG: hypothetical protein D3911_13465 [Candidatus Electrothrix sp. AW3_4]|nr:hypothetical protein [Candidatus Electrothrix gigas]